MAEQQDLHLIPAPDEARSLLDDLVQRYRHNAEAYRKPSYKEAQCRVEFIDPFFEALGWDIHNKQGYAERYKEVIHEATLRVGGATKAPDYGFRVGGQLKFFLEAKKPSVDVTAGPGPAYQLRRYAWSANLPLSILTDFEELASGVRHYATDYPDW
jgi:predicted type IV restriction endonuclease